MTYFSNITNLDELKKAYKALVIKMHPDRGGNAQEFKAMLNEYEQRTDEITGNTTRGTRAHRSAIWAQRGRRMIYEYTGIQYIYVLVDAEKGEFLRVFSDDFASVEDVEYYDHTETHMQSNTERIRPYSAKFGIGYYWDDEAPLYTEAEIAEFEKRARNFEHWRNIYEEQEAERERKEKAERLAEYMKRCKKWAHMLQEVPAVTANWGEPERKEQERKAHSVRRANVLTMARAVFPGVKFSLTFSHHWGGGFTVSWTDGPSAEEVREKCDFDLFVSQWDTFDGMEDLASVAHAEFTEFAHKFGKFSGSVSMDRHESEAVKMRIVDAIATACPEFAEDVKAYRENPRQRFTCRSISREKVAEIAKAAGATNWENITSGGTIWHDWDAHEVDTWAHVIAVHCSFAVVQEEKKPVFTPKHNATYKAVKKAMGAHCIGTRTQNGRYLSDNDEILDIYTLIDFAPGKGLYFGNVFTYENKSSFSSFWSSSHANDAKRVARYAVAGITIKSTGEIVAIDPAVIEGLKADRADVEAQRKAWEEAQKAPKAEKTTRTTAQPTADTTPATEGETLAEADGVTLSATEKGAQLTGNTYAHKSEIKAHGARWFGKVQAWTIKPEQVGEFVELVNSWRTDEEPTEAAPDAEPVAQPAEEAPRYSDAEEITDTAEAVNAEPVADVETDTAEEVPTMSAEDVEKLRALKAEAERKDAQTAEAVARIAQGFAAMCQMLADVATAQRQEAERTARESAKAEQVQTLRDGIATLSEQLAKMSEQLRTMSEQLAELTGEDPQTEAEAPQGATATADTLHDAEEITNEPTATADPFEGMPDSVRKIINEIKAKGTEGEHGAKRAELLALLAEQWQEKPDYFRKAGAYQIERARPEETAEALACDIVAIVAAYQHDHGAPANYIKACELRTWFAKYQPAA